MFCCKAHFIDSSAVKMSLAGFKKQINKANQVIAFSLPFVLLYFVALRGGFISDCRCCVMGDVKWQTNWQVAIWLTRSINELNEVNIWKLEMESV